MGNIGDETIAVITVGDSLDAAVGEKNVVRSRDGAAGAGLAVAQVDVVLDFVGELVGDTGLLGLLDNYIV